ncbi:MAG: hypothetical protein IKP75_03180 [Oscillospiraceae bacterium]|nr:hypothetical protein [Oscillospiraceae bacterium]
MADTIVEYKILSEDEQQYWRDFYEEIRKHDEATALGHARREGRAEGMAAGRAEGIAAGRIEAYKAIARKMRSSGYSMEQIKALLGDDYIG